MRPFFILLLLFTSIDLRSQDKHDNLWVLGKLPNQIDIGFGGTLLDFSQNSVSTSYFSLAFTLFGHASVCDKNGNLAFYTNGCGIANANHEVMTNGDSINPGYYNEQYCDSGYPSRQGMIILPYPGHPNQYLYFHLRNQNTGLWLDLLYTQVDMDTPDGLGRVVSKNQFLHSAYYPSNMMAVRHGNGRDWWLILPVTNTNQIEKYLISPVGITGPTIQSIGDPWNYPEYSGQCVFSPDGTKFVMSNPWNGIRIMNFDRCGGTFSNYKKLPLGFLNADSLVACGVSISPNSKYLYLSSGVYLHQFDLQSSNVAATRTFIGKYDGFLSLARTTFYLQMLAPDGKIYMTCTNDVNIMHIIHDPNEPGIACNFEQHGLPLLSYHSWHTPNFPNFRLYDKQGSPCDSLGIDGPMVDTGDPPEVKEDKLRIRIVPNPTTGTTEVRLAPNHSSGHWILYSNLGQQVMTGSVVPDASVIALDLKTYPSGVYHFVMTLSDGKVQRQMIVLQP